jgi:hypothetical protein
MIALAAYRLLFGKGVSITYTDYRGKEESG